MNYLGALLIVAGFVAVLHALKLVGKATIAAKVAQRAVADLRNPEMDDDAKEAAMQSHALRLFGLFLVLLLGGTLAVLAPVGIIYLLHVLRVLSFSSVLETTLAWRFLVGTTALSLVGWWLVRRR